MLYKDTIFNINGAKYLLQKVSLRTSLSNIVIVTNNMNLLNLLFVSIFYLDDGADVNSFDGALFDMDFTLRSIKIFKFTFKVKILTIS